MNNSEVILTSDELKALLEKGLYDEILSNLAKSDLTPTEIVFRAISNMRCDGEFLVEKLDELACYASLAPIMKFIKAFYLYQNNEPEKSCIEFNQLYLGGDEVSFEVREWNSFGCIFNIEEIDRELKINFPSISEVAPDDVSGDYVILISCDLIYFNLYADLLYQSAMLLDDDIILHFHIICEKEKHGCIEEELYENTAFSYSSFTFAKGAVQYYAISRYLVLPDIMDRYSEMDVLVVDADVLLNKKIGGFVSKVRKEKSHVGIVSPYFQNASIDSDKSVLGFTKFFSKAEPVVEKKYLRHMPWRAVKAGLIMVRNDDKGRAFSAFLASAILQLFLQRSEKVLWWLDQGVLFSILCQLDKIGLEPADISYISALFPLELHTRNKAKALGNERMDKHEYLSLRLDEMSNEI